MDSYLFVSEISRVKQLNKGTPEIPQRFLFFRSIKRLGGSGIGAHRKLADMIEWELGQRLALFPVDGLVSGISRQGRESRISGFESIIALMLEFLISGPDRESTPGGWFTGTSPYAVPGQHKAQIVV